MKFLGPTRRWRSGEFCFVTGVLLSVRMRERPILTGRDVIDEVHFPAWYVAKGGLCDGSGMALLSHIPYHR